MLRQCVLASSVPRSQDARNTILGSLHSVCCASTGKGNQQPK